MPSALRKRGKVWHFDFTANGERYRGSTGCHQKRDAQVILDRKRREAALGEAQELTTTLEAAAALWFIARGEGKKSEKDISQRLEIMLSLIDPRQDVTKIGPKEIEAAIQHRRQQITRQGRPPSNATVNRDLIDTTLRPILNYCASNLELPIRKIEWKRLRLKEPPGRARTFSAGELKNWRANLPLWHQPLFDFYARYGVRLEEIFFPLDALDLDGGKVTLRDRKVGPNHIIPLLAEDLALMKSRVARARAAGLDTVWFRERKGGKLTPINSRAYQWASKRALRAAGIDDAKPTHDLRHHAGSNANRRGGLMVAKQLLGHASIQSTVRYAHVSDEDVLDALSHKKGHTPKTERGKKKGNNA